LMCLSSATRASTIKGRRMLSLHEECRRSRTLERTCRRGAVAEGCGTLGKMIERPQAVALSSTAMLLTTTAAWKASGLDIRLCNWNFKYRPGMARRRKSKEPQQCTTAREAPSAATALRAALDGAVDCLATPGGNPGVVSVARPPHRQLVKLEALLLRCIPATIRGESSCGVFEVGASAARMPAMFKRASSSQRGKK